MYVLAALVALGSIAALARAVEGSWLSPGPLFAAIWVGYTCVSCLIFGDLPGDSWLVGIGWVALCCLAVHGGALLAIAWQRRNASPGVFPPMAPMPSLARFATILLVLSTGYALYLLRRDGGTAELNLDAFARVSQDNRSDDYEGRLGLTNFDVVLLTCGYLASALSGLLIVFRRGMRSWVLASGCVVAITATGALLGSRGGILYGGAFALAAYLAGVLFRDGPAQTKRLSFLLRPVAVLGVVFAISVGIMVIRAHDLYTGDVSTEALARRLSDGASYPAAFAIWFRKTNCINLPHMFGGRTFRGPLRILGIEYLPEELTQVDAHISSNIYTVLRGAIEDFGVVGSCVWFAILGFVGRLAFVRVQQRSLAALWALMVIYAYFIASSTVSILMYNCNLLAFATLGTYLALVGSSARIAARRVAAGTGSTATTHISLEQGAQVTSKA